MSHTYRTLSYTFDPRVSDVGTGQNLPRYRSGQLCVVGLNTNMIDINLGAYLKHTGLYTSEITAPQPHHLRPTCAFDGDTAKVKPQTGIALIAKTVVKIIW